MDIREHQNRQADRASTLAEALGDFLDAHAEYRDAMTKWNESNAKEGSQRWQQLEADVDEQEKPRQTSARNLLGVIEDLVGIRYSVVQDDG